MSNKALFYIDNLQAGTVIVLDDTSLSDDMSEILKGVTTSFKKPFIYRTVNKDRKDLSALSPNGASGGCQVEGSRRRPGIQPACSPAGSMTRSSRTTGS